jgi:hypothetical protein
MKCITYFNVNLSIASFQSAAPEDDSVLKAKSGIGWFQLCCALKPQR